ncbi:hypothetical protein PIB30_079519 [Stylosanthes scabra]|uniref:Uncharacterized protein n=1 Tax=Stylosanthes scabra TaxID=79078 RepID=A0ABU6ZPV0_9FABA|nr:hypothetical protein [Stylosanthes scabra]
MGGSGDGRRQRSHGRGERETFNEREREGLTVMGDGAKVGLRVASPGPSSDGGGSSLVVGKKSRACVISNFPWDFKSDENLHLSTWANHHSCQNLLNILTTYSKLRGQILGLDTDQIGSHIRVFKAQIWIGSDIRSERKLFWTAKTNKEGTASSEAERLRTVRQQWRRIGEVATEEYRKKMRWPVRPSGGDEQQKRRGSVIY